MKTTKTINLSFEPRTSKNPKTVLAKQLDNLTRAIAVRLESAVPSDASVILRGTKPDSSVFELVGERVSETEYIFRLTESALSVSGRIACEVVCIFFESGIANVCSTEVFFIENVARAAVSGTEEINEAVTTVPSLVESALSDAKKSGTFDGKDGKDGKSAYDFARDGGFAGSVAEFSAKLAEPMPKKLSDLSFDSDHRTVSDGEKESWNKKVDSDTLDEAITSAFSAFNRLGKNANALKKTAIGEILRFEDALPERHLVKGVVKSKNLLPRFQETTNNGITFSPTGDGGMVINGTATNDATLVLSTANPAGVYTLSLNNDSTLEGENLKFTLFTKYGSLACELLPDEVNKTVSHEYQLEPSTLVIRVIKGATISSFKVYPQFERGSVATSFVPPVEPSFVNFKIYGKNLIPPTDHYQFSNGFSAVPDVNGSVVISGKCENASLMTVIELALYGGKGGNESVTLKENTDYTLTVFKNGNAMGGGYVVEIYYPDTGETILGTSLGDRTRERILKSVRYEKKLSLNNTSFNGVHRIMLELGTKRSDYEIYRFEEAVSDANGEFSFLSYAPTTTVVSQVNGALGEVTYSADTNKVIERIINAVVSLGGEI